MYRASTASRGQNRAKVLTKIVSEQCDFRLVSLKSLLLKYVAGKLSVYVRTDHFSTKNSANNRLYIYTVIKFQIQVAF